MSDQGATRELTMATNTASDNATTAMMPPIVSLPKVCGDEERGTIATTTYHVKMLSSMCSLLKKSFSHQHFYSFFVK
jgi:hypothetical protein